MSITEKEIQCMACHGAGQPLEHWSYEVPARCLATEVWRASRQCYPFSLHCNHCWTPCLTPQVDVEISHCGVCGSDIHQLDDAWGGACFPLVPGHEIIGHVRQVGEGVTTLQLGQRVGIGVQRSCCHACPCCEDGLEQLCPKITKV